MTRGHVTVLPSDDGGRYPNGHSLLVRGGEETVLIDPSLSIAALDRPPEGIDRVRAKLSPDFQLQAVGAR